MLYNSIIQHWAHKYHTSPQDIFTRLTASKPLTNESWEHSCEIFMVILQWKSMLSKCAKWETDTKAETATWNKIKILQSATVVRLFCLIQKRIGSQLILSTDSSRYLQINTWTSKDRHKGKTPNYSIGPCPTPDKHSTVRATTDTSFQHFLS